VGAEKNQQAEDQKRHRRESPKVGVNVIEATVPARMRIERGLAAMSLGRVGLLLLAALGAVEALAAQPSGPKGPPLVALTMLGPPQTVFDHRKDACSGSDVPDAPARAFRDNAGGVVLFAPHYDNRAMRGASFDALKLDCRITLPSGDNADPAAYDDQNWITATWTEDGSRVAALVHHEYHAADHPGRCRAKDYMSCWYNTITGVLSTDGGGRFEGQRPPAVVAAAPFKQDVEQGRHRGFFNPSNIFGDGRFRYFLASTTGWDGQDSGACLFRSDNAFDLRRWRAFDGAGFTIAYPDPYRAGAAAPRACRPIAPFPAPVGSVVRHRGTGAWIAVFQASAGAEFPEPGFYVTSSSDLLTWDKPRLLIAGKTLYDDPCTAGGRMIAYPSLIDRDAKGRNFDDVGDAADLYFTTLKVDGCKITSERDLLRRRVAIKVLK
jgi:hypothetical protein